MSGTTSDLPVWPLAGAAGLVVLVAAAGTVVVAAGATVRTFDAGMVVTFLVIGLLGSLLARRRPGHRIGPLLLATATPIVVWGLAVAWAQAGRTTRLPLVDLASWATTWAWMPSISLLALTMLVFPTGEPPSRGWRLVPHAIVGHVVVVTVMASLLLPGWDLPPGARTLSTVPAASVLDLVANVPLPVLLLVACVALVARFRRAVGVERLQLRWLRVAMLGLVVVTFLPFVIGDGEPVEVAWYAIGVQLAVLAIPVAMTVAVLRYRLYELDRLISRVVAYAVVVSVTVLAYLVLVLGLGAAARVVAGAPGDLVVAVSTLATAALVQPLRRRVLRTVERRFNRARYDADLVVDTFGRELRDQVDVTAVRSELRSAATRILQPASAGVWVAGRGSGS